MDPLTEIDPTFFNDFTITGLIALICFTIILIVFKGTIRAILSKVFGIDRRKKDNGNGKDEPRRGDDTITREQMEIILLKRDNAIDGKINGVKEVLTGKLTDSKEELTKLITEETSKIYNRMDDNKKEVLDAILKIGRP